MADKPVEQKVFLNAEGSEIFDVFKRIDRQLEDMRVSMQTIHTMNRREGRRYLAQLKEQSKTLSQQMAVMRNTVGARNNAGFNIQDANANQKLARATQQATNYQRSIYGVTNALEALQAKENSLNRAMAERGKQNKFATVQQQRQSAVYKEQIRQLQALDRELTRVNRKRNSQNFAPDERRLVDREYQRLMRSRQTLENAALSPRRVNIERELSQFQASLDNFSRFVQQRRALSAQRIRDERQAAREINRLNDQRARNEERTQARLEGLRRRSRLQDRQAGVAGRARQITDERLLQTELERSRQRLARLQTERLKADTPRMHQRKSRSIELEKAYTRALERQSRALEKRNGTEASGASKPEMRNGAVGTILSPGYGVAAMARTGVYGAAAAAIYGMFNTIRDGTRFVVELEDGLARLQAISGSTSRQMVSLEKSILGVARGTRFSTSELLKVSTVLAQAGIAADQMEDVLRSVIDLAVASGSSTEEAVQLVTSAIGAFQLQTSEAARVADLMTVALNRTKLTVQQTGLAIQYVGAAAFESNITLDQLLATAAALAQAGVKSGSTIGTGFRRFLVDLRTPTKKLQQEFEKLGLTQADVDIKTRGLSTVLETLRDAGFGASAAYAGLETRSAAFYLVAKNNVDIIDQLQLAFTAQNSAAESNKIAMATLTAQWQRFSNILGEITNMALEGPFDNWKAALTDFNDYMEDVLERMLQNKTSFWEEFTRVDPEEARLKQEIREQITGNPNVRESDFDPLGGRERTVNQLYAQYLVQVEKAASSTSDALDEMQTEVNEASEAFYAQQGILGEVDKDYGRLLTQKENYLNNDLRLQSETLTLMNRFEGLAQYLGTLENGYDDLTNALNNYRNVQAQVLASDTAVYQGALRAQNIKLSEGLFKSGSDILSSPEFANLSGRQQDSVRLLIRQSNGVAVDEDARGKAVGDVADAIGISGQSSAFADLLRNLSVGQRQMISNSANIAALSSQRDVARWQGNTGRGRQFTQMAAQARALIARAEPLKDPTNSELAPKINSLIGKMEDLMSGRASQGFERGVDFGRSELNSIRQQWTGMGMKFESGRRSSGGSRRRGRDIEQQERERFQRALDSRSVRLAKDGMEESLENMAQASTIAAFRAASDNGINALEDLKAALRTQALNDLDRRGIAESDPQYDNRMAQLEAEIDQVVDDYNDRIARDLVQSLRQAVEAAALKFEKGLLPAQGQVARAQGAVQGLQLRSNQNRIPDYVAVNAQDRLGRAQEGLLRQTAADMPSLIAATEAAIAQKVATLATTQDQTQWQQVNNEIDEQRNRLQALRNEYAALQETLGAENLVPTTIRDGVREAIEAYRVQNELGRSFQEDIIFNLYGGLQTAQQAINGFFTDVLTGSKNVLDAFGDMAMGILNYLQQLAAQFVANQIFSSLLNIIGAAVAPTGNQSGVDASFGLNPGFAFTGGKGEDLMPQLMGGGKVMNGASNRDSVHAKIARDEWVVQSSAVRSVGDKFMADLNNHGAKALEAINSPVMNFMQTPAQTTNVWLVRPDEQPPLGPDDVLVIMQDDLINGQSRKLIKSISQGG